MSQRGREHRQLERRRLAAAHRQPCRGRREHPVGEGRGGSRARPGAEVAEANASLGRRRQGLAGRRLGGSLGARRILHDRAFRHRCHPALQVAPAEQGLRLVEQIALRVTRRPIGAQQGLQPLQRELQPPATAGELAQLRQQLRPVLARHRFGQVALHALQLTRGEPRRQLVEQALDDVDLRLADRPVDPRRGAEHLGQREVERLPIIGALALVAGASQQVGKSGTEHRRVGQHVTGSVPRNGPQRATGSAASPAGACQDARTAPSFPVAGRGRTR